MRSLVVLLERSIATVLAAAVPPYEDEADDEEAAETPTLESLVGVFGANGCRAPLAQI